MIPEAILAFFGLSSIAGLIFLGWRWKKIEGENGALREQLDVMQQSEEKEDEVAELSHDDLVKRASRWVRKKPR
jgi:hypothetical protein